MNPTELPTTTTTTASIEEELENTLNRDSEMDDGGSIPATATATATATTTTAATITSNSDAVIPKKKSKKKNSSVFPKLGCFRSDFDSPTVERSYGSGNFDIESASAGTVPSPTHLVIMVNGIIGSAQDWRFAAKHLLKRYPQDLIVHCSECNYSTLTFHGVDVMGNRLADEVISVIKCYPPLRKISFICHSLGGLVARYAIAKLYGRVISRETSHGNGEHKNGESKDQPSEEKFKGKIAGLEPINFITSATPHLGSKGHKQAPFFCGLYTMEKVGLHTSWLLGRSGKHLYLRDGKKDRPPLLVQMVKDTDNLPFISALQSFKRRVAYANARFDYLVGWSTSSLRRQSELPKRRSLLRSDKYPHIVNVEAAKTVEAKEEVPLEAPLNKSKTVHMEETMLRNLTRMSWERVDVDFNGSLQMLSAHSTIQVKSYCMHSDGADVIQHMIDNFEV